MLGGLVIEEGPGLEGHSDADVLLHAITDAILGAAALGDIGRHFPPSDPTYAQADSADFLRRAAALVSQAGWAIANVDSTVQTEVPVLHPYIDRMRARIAEILGVEADRVSVKAKTSEGLGAIGRKEAMKASAAVILVGRT